MSEAGSAAAHEAAAARPRQINHDTAPGDLVGCPGPCAILAR